jgi:glycosyltransferase involved in cell wall biosynthesis
LISAPTNTKIIQKTIGALGISKKKVFVNASIDTLFETRWATGRRIATGYNVLSLDGSPSFSAFLDRLAGRTSIDKIVAHTNHQRRLYMKTGVKKERIRIVPHCIDPSRIEAMSSQPTKKNAKPTIFYGGRLTIEKGVKELLDSYHQISKRVESTLILMGKGPLEEWILDRKKALEKENPGAKVVYLGWQPTHVFLSKMREADLVVVPSYDEPFGIVLLEAMALKKPIVATRSGGITEIITDGLDGVLVDPHNADKLTDAILELLGNSRMRTSIGSNAFKTVEKKYDVSKVAPRFIDFMEA